MKIIVEVKDGFPEKAQDIILEWVRARLMEPDEEDRQMSRFVKSVDVEGQEKPF